MSGNITKSSPKNITKKDISTPYKPITEEIAEQLRKAKHFNANGNKRMCHHHLHSALQDLGVID